MRKLLFAILFFAPTFAFAQMPAFPMAFWGDITVNGVPAPVGTVVRAYYGSVLAGEVSVQETGIYGYTQPTQQKLLISEGAGTITFTFQTPGGSETNGATAITHSAFASGETLEKDLIFTVSVSTPPPSGGGGSGGGGGGGGGVPQVLGASTSSSATSTASSTNPATTTSLVELARTLQVLIQKLKTLGGAVDVSVEKLINSLAGAPAATMSVRDLKLGMSGDDVRALQAVLIGQGHAVPAGATGYFGIQTQKALAAYQRASGISPATGYFGALTRAHMKTKGLAGLWW